MNYFSFNFFKAYYYLLTGVINAQRLPPVWELSLCVFRVEGSGELYSFELMSDPSDPKSPCNDEIEIENLAFALLISGWEVEEVIEKLSSFSTLPQDKIRAIVLLAYEKQKMFADEKQKKRAAFSAQQRNILKNYEVLKNTQSIEDNNTSPLFGMWSFTTIWTRWLIKVCLGKQIQTDAQLSISTYLEPALHAGSNCIGQRNYIRQIDRLAALEQSSAHIEGRNSHYHDRRLSQSGGTSTMIVSCRSGISSDPTWRLGHSYTDRILKNRNTGFHGMF